MKDPKVISGGVAIDDRGSVTFVNDFDFLGVKRFYQVQNHRRGLLEHGTVIKKKLNTFMFHQVQR